MRPPTADLSVESTLRHCDLLEPLSSRQIAELAACVTVRTLREGEQLFKKSEEAHDLYIVVSGRLVVQLSAPDGSPIEWFEAGQYRLCGWSSIVAPHAYAADAYAAEDTTVLVLSAAAAEDVFLTEPFAGYEVMKRIAGEVSVRLRDVKEELIEQLQS